MTIRVGPTKGGGGPCSWRLLCASVESCQFERRNIKQKCLKTALKEMLVPEMDELTKQSNMIHPVVLVSIYHNKSPSINTTIP